MSKANIPKKVPIKVPKLNTIKKRADEFLNRASKPLPSFIRKSKILTIISVLVITLLLKFIVVAIVVGLYRFIKNRFFPSPPGPTPPKPIPLIPLSCAGEHEVNPPICNCESGYEKKEGKCVKSPSPKPLFPAFPAINKPYLIVFSMFFGAAFLFIIGGFIYATYLLFSISADLSRQRLFELKNM